MSELPEGLTEFIAGAGWSEAAIDPIPGDASFRRYFRLKRPDGARAMLMYAPPPEEDPSEFLRVAAWLTGHGMRAPEIFATEPQAGWVLLEDFGDDRMRDWLDRHPDAEIPAYETAIETLVELHQRPAGPFSPYDIPTYQREAGLFTEWYCPAQGLEVDAAGYAAAWDEVLAPMMPRQARAVTVLRDYHAENIMLLRDPRARAPHHQAQGLIDFQDALIGHPAYDLVSLLQDARRDVSPELEAAMLAHYCERAGADGEFAADYARLGAQRNAKIVGIFARLYKRDGKPRYLGFIPRVWEAMERDLAHPALDPVARWFAANVPDDLRRARGHDPMTGPMTQLASDTAMVMAAGLGKRMRPLTASQPKPLVRVAGKPLIDHALDRLAEAGVTRAVVNVHYLADALEAHVLERAAPKVIISDEREELLETGGGLIKAQDHLPDPFFCLNADNIWLDGPRNAFAELSQRWNPDEMDGLLLVVPHARATNFDGPGDFYMDPRGVLSRRRPGRIAPFIFTGIQLIAHRLLRDAPAGKFSTNLLWNRAIAEGRLYGVAFTGLWFEVGTPQAIGPTEAALQRG